VRRPGIRLIHLLASVGYLALPGMAQSQSAQPQFIQAESSPTEPEVTLKAYSRMVTVELVVKDSKGNHVTGLKPEDFQLFEQTPGQGRGKRQQKIASFREANIAGLGWQSASAARAQPGVYSNAVSLEKADVPPTILLVDGINTDVRYQAQVQLQMLKMLQQLPADVPVAVLLLGRKLVMLQDFTSDPRLLQAALSKATSSDGRNLAQLDPRDDPNSVLNLLLSAHAPMTPEMLAAALNDDDRAYSEQMDTRVRITEEALISIARHMAGYPGRKNLLWISTAFPIDIFQPPFDHPLDQVQGPDYQARIQRMTNALSDAKIAVYPINPAGVRLPPGYEFQAQPFDIRGPSNIAALKRDMEAQARRDNTMQLMADATGGVVCTGDNDLADCVHKAVDDSSEFYEIAYYPNSKNWKGEYRRIVLESKVKGLRLEYRQGYYATPLDSDDPRVQAAEMQVSCDDSLDATAVTFKAIRLPADAPDQLKFGIAIDLPGLTLTGVGNQLEVDVAVAVCTLDKKGSPIKLMNYPIHRVLSAREAVSLAAGGAVSEAIFVPGPKPAAVRLLVKDVASGRLGSIYIKTDDLVATSSTKMSGAGETQPHR
jgi:VWFA-related protein